jgi:hypothetical protein
MVRRNRRPDWRRIKTLRSYTIDEAAAALRVHRNAVRYWMRKQDLPFFADQRPFLILGGDLVAFLKSRRRALRRTCGPGQMYCLKCKEPRTPPEGMIEYQPMTLSRGMLVGICPVCETLMRRFTSLGRLAAFEHDSHLQIAHHQERLTDTAEPRLSCYFNNET